MSYLVLARKYRPEDFNTVTGQEHVTRTLANAIKRNKVVHAFLFSGPRGVGKTSVARVLAKALNCEKGPTATPCLKCSNCLEIGLGRSMAVMEIDGASHNSVDNVRDLIDTLRSLPPPGSRYKVYIIDEVHMLSVSAFNALLKSLEEPPPNTVFILATTELHKIPDTVISRCQRHDFRAITSDGVEDRLKEIAKLEKLDVEPEVFRIISRLSEGSMRDAQSMLDRVQSFASEKIGAKEVSQILGIVERALLFKISAAIFSKQAQEALTLVNQAFSTGLDPRIFLKDFVTHWRELLLAKFGGEAALKSIVVSADDIVELRRQVESLNQHDLQDLVHLAMHGADGAIRSTYPKYVIEALLVRMATRESVVEIGKIIANNFSDNKTPVARVNKPSMNLESNNQPSPVVVTKASTFTKLQDQATPDWKAFVSFAQDQGARMLSEQLKHVGIKQFTWGVLHVSGGSLIASSFQRAENVEKLKDLLVKYSQSAGVNTAVWDFKIEKADVAEGSIVHTQKVEKKKARDEGFEDANKHPLVEDLKKLFPGSEVEDIS